MKNVVRPFSDTASSFPSPFSSLVMGPQALEQASGDNIYIFLG